MKIATPCMECVFDNPESYDVLLEYITIQDNDLYHFKCKNGHNNLLEIQAFKFEILFESGLCAIRDKYFLESVLSLTASLERFYEFFIRIIMKANGLQSDIFEKIFKNISNQSERQFGAFICIYGVVYKESPPMLLEKKYVEFRNKVVHKGYLPCEDEVLQYAKEVFIIIKHYYSMILLQHKKHLFDYISEIQNKRRVKNRILIEELQVEISTMSPCFALKHTLSMEDFNKRDFDTCFNFILKQNCY